MLRFRFALAAAAALACASAVCAQPVTVTDAMGRTVRVERPPQRIVPLFASNTEIVAALGLSDRIVGIDGMTHFPPSVTSKPKVGGRLGFSPEAVLRQRPDLLIVTPSRQAVNQLLDPMSRVGVPVVVLQQRSVAEIIANIRLVGRIAGVPERGEALANGQQARLYKVAAAAAPACRPRVVLVTGQVGSGLLLVARPGGYTWDAVRLAGGRSAFPETLRIPQISPEAVLRADPDELLFAGAKQDLDRMLAGQGWRGLRAVQAGRVHTVARASFTIPGPRTVEGVEALAATLRADCAKPAARRG